GHELNRLPHHLLVERVRFGPLDRHDDGLLHLVGYHPANLGAATPQVFGQDPSGGRGGAFADGRWQRLALGLVFVLGLLLVRLAIITNCRGNGDLSDFVRCRRGLAGLLCNWSRYFASFFSYRGGRFCNLVATLLSHDSFGLRLGLFRLLLLGLFYFLP